MSSTTTLLPCPFCSNADISIKNESPKDNSGGYFIECPGCGASTSLRFACGDDPTHLLAEQWNRRTTAHCLHQIQEPAAAEQAAWHAGLDEGRAQATGSVSNATSQAAPAAVNPSETPNSSTIAVPSGWKLVPDDATPEWVENLEALPDWRDAVGECIKKFLAASPVAPQAAPAAVAVPEKLPTGDVIRAIARSVSTSSSDSPSSSEYVMAGYRAALAATPAAAKRQFTDGTRTLRQDCISVIRDFAGSKPEDGEDWESWFEAAFDLLGSRINAVFDEHSTQTAAAPVVLPEPDDYKQEIDSKNCMQCSVAYLLGLPLHMVPDFAAQETAQQSWELFESFIASQGYAAVMLTGIHEFETDYLASGTSPRGIPHMVVMNDGNLVHDPHPSNAGLSDVQCIWLVTRRALLAAATGLPAQAVEVDDHMALADALDPESDYQRGYRHGYNRRDAEVQGALL